MLAAFITMVLSLATDQIGCPLSVILVNLLSVNEQYIIVFEGVHVWRALI